MPIHAAPGEPQPEPAPAGAPTLDASACRQRIEAVDLTKIDTIAAAGACRWEAAGTQAGREVLATATRRDAQWAAVWVYGTLGYDPAPLRPMLQNSDASVRTMAAAALFRLGERPAIAALLDGMANQDVLLGSAPPTTIAAFAARAVARVVVRGGVPSPSAEATEEAALVGRWRDWLAQNEGELAYDPMTASWSMP